MLIVYLPQNGSKEHGLMNNYQAHKNCKQKEKEWHSACWEFVMREKSAKPMSTVELWNAVEAKAQAFTDALSIKIQLEEEDDTCKCTRED